MGQARPTFLLPSELDDVEVVAGAAEDEDEVGVALDEVVGTAALDVVTAAWDEVVAALEVVAFTLDVVGAAADDEGASELDTTSELLEGRGLQR